MPKSKRNTTEQARNKARALRTNMGQTERLLWSQLRRSAIGFRFRRQYPVGPYIVDFFCHQAQLAVEVDGEWHDRSARAAKDVVRDAYLKRAGIDVLRFRTVDVLESLEAVLEQIHRSCRERAPGGPPP